MSFTLKEILEISAKANMDKKQVKSEIHKCVKAKIQDAEARISNFETTKKSLLSLLERWSSSKSIDDCMLLKPLK